MCVCVCVPLVDGATRETQASPSDRDKESEQRWERLDVTWSLKESFDPKGTRLPGSLNPFHCVSSLNTKLGKPFNSLLIHQSN